MSERIYIPEIKAKLSYKDTRSVIRWCSNNKVKLFLDIGSKRLFALRDDFDSSYAPNRISPEVLNPTMRFFAQYEHLKTEKAKEYIPKGEHEKAYLSMLQNIIRTL